MAEWLKALFYYPPSLLCVHYIWSGGSLNLLFEHPRPVSFCYGLLFMKASSSFFGLLVAQREWYLKLSL